MPLTREQMRLGTNVYGNAAISPATGLTEPLHPTFGRWTVTHPIPKSVVQPRKDLGPSALVIQGTIMLYETSVFAFCADVGDDSTDRKLYWVDSGVEVYAWVNSGTTTRQTLGEGGSMYFQLISFEFESLRTAVYKAADDTIWMGG